MAVVKKARKADKGFVVVCGYGRVGRIVCELLDAEGTLSWYAFDSDPDKALAARTRGLPVFYGDCSRPEVLTNFKVGEARLLVVALDRRETTDRCCATMRRLHPKLPILVRAQSTAHQKELIQKLGVISMVPRLPPDSALISLPFGGAALKGLGFPVEEVDTLLEKQRRRMFGMDKLVTEEEEEEAFQLGVEAAGKLKRGLLFEQAEPSKPPDDADCEPQEKAND